MPAHPLHLDAENRPSPKVSKAPLSVGHISVNHGSYTISAKCSTREDKEWKVKESYATRTGSYTVDGQASVNSVHYSSESKGKKEGHRQLSDEESTGSERMTRGG